MKMFKSQASYVACGFFVQIVVFNGKDPEQKNDSQQSFRVKHLPWTSEMDQNFFSFKERVHVTLPLAIRAHSCSSQRLMATLEEPMG